MKKNKIIDTLVKKLILHNFNKDEIFKLIDINNEFIVFENYIYYLYLLSFKKYDSSLMKMCNCLQEYLQYLVETFHIIPLNIDNIAKGEMINNYELFILGVKGYDTNNNFYFDVSDNMYLCLDHNVYQEYKGIFNIKYNDKYLDSKINQKIFNKQINKIYIFKKANMKNIFLGTFVFVFNTFIYLDKMQYESFVVCREEIYSDNIVDIFRNINARKQKESLELYKQELITSEIKSTGKSLSFLNIINQVKCHSTLIDAINQHAIANQKISLLETIKYQLNDWYEAGFNLFRLIPKISLINEYQLSLLSNGFDILMGCQINSDYLNNVFIANKNLEINNDIISLRFIKSFSGRFFDVQLNAKIFNTINEHTCVYIFKKQDDKYLFLGFYKCFKIVIGKDAKNNKTPIFKLREISDIEYVKHINYVNENMTSNSYKNVFLDLVTKNIELKNWISKMQVEKVLILSRRNDYLNSLLYKYNWITRKCINSSTDNPIFIKNWKLYRTFDLKHMQTVFEIVTNNFSYLINNAILYPYTIAYEMTKQNWSNKSLFEISYIDHYQTNHYKYDLCLNIIKNKNNV